MKTETWNVGRVTITIGEYDDKPKPLPITSSVMIAKAYNGQDPTGWWMSEKLDGVRAVWNGKEFVSKNRNIFDAPDWFIKGMPTDIKLDGELWLGRGKFQQTVGKVRSYGNEWLGMMFRVFDVIGSDKFEDRMKGLDSILPNHCMVIPQTACRDHEHLAQFEKGILAFKGEGVVLRKPGSLYTPGKTNNVLKMKKVVLDEALVLEHAPGKHGKTGALVCEWQGQVFNLGSGLEGKDRECPPGVGKMVTFKYHGVTDRGKPRHAFFVICRDYE